MIVEIKRNYEQGATIGTIIVSGETIGFTMELPWYGNKKNISCIPEGEYVCKKHDSATFGDVYEVCDVFGRSNILFHVGNSIEDTEGCILLGKYVGHENGKRWLYESKNALRTFKDHLFGYDEFLLIITDNSGRKR